MESKFRSIAVANVRGVCVMYLVIYLCVCVCKLHVHISSDFDTISTINSSMYGGHCPGGPMHHASSVLINLP